MRLMCVETIQAINVKHVVAKGEACTPPTFDHRTVAIHLNIVLGWRLLRERRLSAQGGMQHRWGRDRDRRSSLHHYMKCQDCMIDFDARRFVKVVA